tara:strand:+ start:5014 stop:6489 length:1476 start_codon:yes stop_codon:yes gene_type:complete
MNYKISGATAALESLNAILKDQRDRKKDEMDHSLRMMELQLRDKTIEEEKNWRNESRIYDLMNQWEVGKDQIQYTDDGIPFVSADLKSSKQLNDKVLEKMFTDDKYSWLVVPGNEEQSLQNYNNYQIYRSAGEGYEMSKGGFNMQNVPISYLVGPDATPNATTSEDINQVSSIFKRGLSNDIAKGMARELGLWSGDTEDLDKIWDSKTNTMKDEWNLRWRAFRDGVEEQETYLTRTEYEEQKARELDQKARYAELVAGSQATALVKSDYNGAMEMMGNYVDRTEPDDPQVTVGGAEAIEAVDIDRVTRAKYPASYDLFTQVYSGAYNLAVEDFSKLPPEERVKIANENITLYNLLETAAIQRQKMNALADYSSDYIVAPDAEQLEAKQKESYQFMDWVKKSDATNIVRRYTLLQRQGDTSSPQWQQTEQAYMGLIESMKAKDQPLINAVMATPEFKKANSEEKKAMVMNAMVNLKRLDKWAALINSVWDIK